MYRIESYESTVSMNSTELTAVDEAQAMFENVGTIQELQQHTIQFLRGDLQATCYHYGPLLPESSDLVDKLVRLNELGFITVSSQPGATPLSRLRGVRSDPVYQRCYVEGILPRRLLNLFTRALYSRLGEHVFVLNPETDLSYEEIQHLKYEDCFWVTKDRHDKGILHISESMGACNAFASCKYIYHTLQEEYVSLYIMDTRWGEKDMLLVVLAEVLGSLQARSVQAMHRIRGGQS